MLLAQNNLDEKVFEKSTSSCRSNGQIKVEHDKIAQIGQANIGWTFRKGLSRGWTGTVGVVL